MTGLLPNSASCKYRAMDYMLPVNIGQWIIYRQNQNSFPPVLPIFPENISECSIKHKWLIKAKHFYVIKFNNTSFSMENIYNIHLQTPNYGLAQISNPENT